MYAVIALFLVRNQILDHLSFFSLCLGHCPYSDGCILCYFSSFKPPFHLTSSVKASLISDILIASTHGHILIFLPDYAFIHNSDQTFDTPKQSSRKYILLMCS